MILIVIISAKNIDLKYNSYLVKLPNIITLLIILDNLSFRGFVSVKFYQIFAV